MRELIFLGENVTQDIKEALKFRIECAQKKIRENRKCVDNLQRQITALNANINEILKEIDKGHETLAEWEKEEFAEKANRGTQLSLKE